MSIQELNQPRFSRTNEFLEDPTNTPTSAAPIRRNDTPRLRLRAALFTLLALMPIQPREPLFFIPPADTKFHSAITKQPQTPNEKATIQDAYIRWIVTSTPTPTPTSTSTPAATLTPELSQAMSIFAREKSAEKLTKTTITHPKTGKLLELNPTVVYAGYATYYDRSGCVGCRKDRVMANGDKLNDNALTIASNQINFPLNTMFQITCLTTGHVVNVMFSDYGGNDLLDLTPAVARALGLRVEQLNPGPGKERPRFQLRRYT